MNRKQKYRGKQVDTGQWIYGSLLTDNKTVYAMLTPTILQNGKLRFRHFDVSKNTVGEYTGWVIQNKELYEGDIIKAEGFEELVIVLWNEVNKCYSSYGEYDYKILSGNDELSILNINVNKPAIRLSLFENFKFQIISNIYDNPELIKK